MLKTKINLDKLISRTKIYLVLIVIILIVLDIIEPKMIIPSIITYIIILSYTIWSNNKRKAEISEHINELTLSVDKAAQSTIINSPFPLVVLETNGNIIWKSSKFIKEFANIEIGTVLNDIIKELKVSINDGKEKNNLITENIEIGEKTYKIITDYTKLKEKEYKNVSEYMAIIYFLDETDYTKLLKEYNEAKTCIGIMVLDNYEELFQRITEEEKLKILAEAEKKMYKWVNKYNGLLIKSERDSYICIFDQLNVEKIKEGKFEILDEIKEIRTQDNIQLTLSIAISQNEESNLEEYKSAKAVIDIALGRGGDQAIIKQNGKYYFFGGRTIEVEKRTRVKARIVAQALSELMNSARNVIIMGHANSDIDAIGSSMGVYRLATNIGKKAYIVNEHNGTSLDTFINDIKESNQYNNILINKNQALELINQESLLVVVDTDRKNYVDVPELLDKTEKIVVIDHHRRCTDYIENAILTFHEVYASSACELVTELIEYADKPIKLETLEVEALYAGIMMDTKNFTFKTGVRTFEAAAYLRKCGVDIIRVKKWFQSDFYTYNRIAEIVAKSEIMNDTIAISEYEKEDENANITCAKAADELLTISNITASFVLGKIDNRIYISGRSIGDINVQLILEKLGGGGHITVAGAQIDNMTMEEVKQELINRINEYFTEIS